MPCRRLALSAAAAFLVASATPALAETEPPLLYEPRLYTPSVERMLVRAKADRLAERMLSAPAPDSVDVAPLLPRPDASAYRSAADRRMDARARTSIEDAQGSAAYDLFSLERDAALADLAESKLWALHALRTFRPDPAAGPKGR